MSYYIYINGNYYLIFEQIMELIYRILGAAVV